jgi:hypothetical protein
VTLFPGRLAATVLALTAATAAARQPVDDSQLKAAIVAKFPEFVQWPPDVWPEGQPLVLCVTERSPVERHLRNVVAGVTIQSRPVGVHVLDSEGDLARCHLLLVSTASPLNTRRLLASAARLPILTVGDDPALLDQGVVLALRPVDGRLRFDADLDAAHRAGLRLRSQLLRLAVEVRGGHQ